MSNLLPASRNLARWLIAREADTPATGRGLRATAPVFAKLRERLVVLVGKAGYRSVLSRALNLAIGDIPQLKGTQINDDGIPLPANSGDAAFEEEINQTADAGECLVAHFLELFFNFIGVSLTLRIVRDIWADAPYDDEIDSEIKETP